MFKGKDNVFEGLWKTDERWLERIPLETGTKTLLPLVNHRMLCMVQEGQEVMSRPFCTCLMSPEKTKQNLSPYCVGL